MAWAGRWPVGRTVDLLTLVLGMLLHTSLAGDPVKKLQMWIDGKETEQFVGVPMDIYVIKDGVVVPYLLDAYYDAQLPILPPEVDLVELTWMAEDEEYTFRFSDLRSLDPHTLYDPLLSIPQYGNIPKTKSAFQMAIPCTGRVTAIASMYIVLHIHDGRGRPVPGSPLKLHLRKRCIAFENKKVCRQGCRNGGKCSDMGRCDCKPGFYGTMCHQAVCFPECINNGTCIKPGVCECQPGYYGDRCEKAICKKDCHNGGTCTAPERCTCPEGHYGQYCRQIAGTCEIPCINGGICTNKNKCSCPDGYKGQFCQNATCRRSCGVHGRCVAVNRCQCKRGWRGRHCNKTVKRIRKDDDDKSRTRRKRTKERSKRLKNGREPAGKSKHKIRKGRGRKKRPRQPTRI